MQVIPVGYRVLVEPDKVEEVSKGGIIVTTTNKKLEQQAQVKGTVIALGTECWRESKAPWCKVGDKVLYQKHVGMRIPGLDGNMLDNYLLLNDEDITAIVRE
jgi:co-chaperonin GroES (HSP10)